MMAQFNSLNANAHIKCVIGGRRTPSQSMIMREQAKIKPADYLAILRFLKEHHPVTLSFHQTHCVIPRVGNRNKSQMKRMMGTVTTRGIGMWRTLSWDQPTFDLLSSWADRAS